MAKQGNSRPSSRADIADFGRRKKGRAGMARPSCGAPDQCRGWRGTLVDPRIKSGDDELRDPRREGSSAVPAELLRLSCRALAEHDVDQRRSAVVHRLVEGAADVLRVLDKKALAAKGFHDAVIACAVDQ